MRRQLCALALVAGAASSASATWSILLINTRTGEIAVGSATCLTNFDLQAGTPVLIPGVGAATAQSFVDQGGFNRVFVRDRLLEGRDPNDIIDLLSSFDGGHQTRQYGIADTLGGTATFTGTGAGLWAGGVTGRVGDIVYAVQGNVLTGDPVVNEAEQVIISSLDAGLDLGETMMLAMEEARLYGGDGRCSCGNDPDGCGSPPDGWDHETGKSAHIAYMLIARAGDGFGCNSVYRVGRQAFGVAGGDFDEDGRLDAVIAAQGDSLIHFLHNTSLSPGFVTFAPSQTSGATGAPSGIAAADFDKDGHLDIAYADQTSDLVGILSGNGDGTFEFAGFDFVPSGPTWIVSADFNGDSWPDAAITSLDGGTVTVLLNDGAGDLVPGQQIVVGTEPWVLVAAEIDGAPGVDLACTDRDSDTLTILANDGNGGFAPWRQLATPVGPLGVTAGDFDGDGRTDLAIATDAGREIGVFRQTSPGVFQTVTLGDSARYTAVEVVDINGDGLDDFVATSFSPVRMTLVVGRSGDDPVVDSVYSAGTQSNDIVIADFTGDGLPDVVHNIRQTRTLMAIAGIDPAEGRGYFSSGDGCATADYYMEFNVAFQSRNDPDPVAQLHDLYDDWRTDLIGITDATRTTAELGTDRLPVGAVTLVTIEPFDWQPAPVGTGLLISAVHSPGSAGLATLGEAIDHGDGTYSVQISAADLPPDARGLDLIEIHVRQGDQTITLMPTLGVTITAPLADWNDDGLVNPADLEAFLTDWAAREGTTDLNGDGRIDTRDVLVYLKAWAGN